MSNASLRRARHRAHRAFDQMWRRLGMRRSAAYRWLAARMGLCSDNCHMSKFSIEQCAEVVGHCQAFGDLPTPLLKRPAARIRMDRRSLQEPPKFDPAVALAEIEE